MFVSCTLSSFVCSPVGGLLRLFLRCWWIPHVRVFLVIILIKTIAFVLEAWLFHEYLVVYHRVIEWFRILWEIVIVLWVHSHFRICMMLKWKHLEVINHAIKTFFFVFFIVSSWLLCRLADHIVLWRRHLLLLAALILPELRCFNFKIRL